ncbi:MAG: outer membrane lipoprotein carrier protein LolA [Myxococcota bacterium]|nr:outer membrane lipoprotein carrier protein LolA [Myxococcota bacterium]
MTRALCVLICLLPSVASAQAPTLESLLSRFAALPGLEARFVEEKRVALLAVPVRSEGRIWFSQDRVMRRVTAPDPSAALIADGRLRMRQGDRTEEIEIGDNPVLRGFVDSFRAVLAGDREALERYYRATLTPGEGESWTLRLVPRDDALRRFLREITMRGDGVTIHEMRMVEVSGDETRTTFTDVDTARRFSPAEARRIFRVE